MTEPKGQHDFPSLAQPPELAVVGPPNKGKSSIVSTLAWDLSVEIDAVSGTTKVAQPIPMQVDGRTLYTLIDTPGFQRARATLDWLKQHADSPGDRPGALRAFVQAFDKSDRFRDEVELLRPIVNGAGVVYVVDGSVPPGDAYEAELEILRWSGRPRLAVINPIDGEAFTEKWKNILSQYLGTVVVFNPVTADFDDGLALLERIAGLDDAWQGPMGEAVALLKRDRAAREREAAEAIAWMLARMLTHEEHRRVPVGEEVEPVKQKLQQRFRDALRLLENRCRDEVAAAYRLAGLERVEAGLSDDGQQTTGLELDLLDKQTLTLFGLSKASLVAAAAGSGAVMGLMLDAAVGGVTLGSGAASGAIGGAALALLGSVSFDQVGKPRARGGVSGAVERWMNPAAVELRSGPLREVNLAFVALNRARLHHRLVSRRAHAFRAAIDMTSISPDALPDLEPAASRSFGQHFGRLRRAGADGLTDAVVAPLADEVEAVLLADRVDAS